MSESQISSVTESIVKEQSVENASVTTRKSTQKGEGYGSERTFVDVKGDNKDLHLIFKCEPHVPEHMTFIITKAFAIETYFYGTLVPALEEFSKAKGADAELPIARCYKTLADCRLLVFENLAITGYQLRDSRTCMSRDELSLVMRRYGKLHATSMALREQDPERFAGLTRDMIVPFNDILLEQFREQMAFSAQNVIDVYCEDKSGDDYAALMRYKENVVEFIKSTGEKSKYPALLHGDCWNNNMLFKYDNGAPTDVKLVDFQLNRVGSPAIDLSYFFYTAASRVELDRLERHLRTYHDSFSSRTRELGGDPNAVYPYEELRNDWRTYCKYGYTMAISVFNVAYRDADEIIDFKGSQAAGDFTEFLQAETRNADLVRARIVDLTAHMFENSLL